MTKRDKIIAEMKLGKTAREIAASTGAGTRYVHYVLWTVRSPEKAKAGRERLNEHRRTDEFRARYNENRRERYKKDRAFRRRALLDNKATRLRRRARQQAEAETEGESAMQ